MNIKAIHHVSFVVADTAKALAFYQGILGLKVCEDRPDLGFAGAWLNLGEQQIHLLELPNPDPIEGRPEHGGRDRHLAVSVLNLQEVIDALETAGRVYTLSKSGRRALFCRDDDGNTLELIEVV
ncbi:MAG: VOC family protein [Gammaproteobacteria bacterium]|nr:VOC family protein [Gammaproteobacteria bacterium]